MFNPNSPFPLWTIWRNIGFEERLVFLTLFLVSVYCLFSATKIISGLRSARGLYAHKDRDSMQLALVQLRSRLANVQQAIAAAFYLFGLVLFLHLATIGNTIDNSKTPPSHYIFENFLLQCAFAANAFLVFLVLQLIQWFLTRQVNSARIA